MKRYVRWMTVVCCLLALSLLLTSCGIPYRDIIGSLQKPESQMENTFDPNMNQQGTSSSNTQGYGDSEESWAIYWYLCGSDLESRYGSASQDLQEMVSVRLPENVQVVVQTGGASMWQNDQIRSDVLGRYLYTSEGLKQVDEQPLANMGDKNTLADFLQFCSQNYPAKHTAVVFWNHGGDFSTVAFDENYGFDSLTLAEMYQAFDEVYDISSENPPFEMVGFDACLMGTIDTANAFSQIARYMVASEELEPGCGWDYEGWLSALAQDPGMDGAELGTVICDSYQEACTELNIDDEITLSVVDLQQVVPLIKAYDALGQEALYWACQDSDFFSAFAQKAVSSEKYGNFFQKQGLMVDLGHLAETSSDLLTQTSGPLLQALNQCVVYRVNGPLHQEASGLSCYYAYSADSQQLEQYNQISASESFKHFYTYQISGQLSQEGLEYVQDLGFDVSSQITTLNLDDYPITIQDGYAYLNLGSEAANTLQEVCFNLFYMDPNQDVIIELGRDNNLNADWQNGVFCDNFNGYWGALDGHICYMVLQYYGDGYNVYSVPILLNGELYSLRVAYLFDQQSYYILGARKILQDMDMLDKNLVQIQPGDEIVTLSYVGTSSDNYNEKLTKMETFIATENTSFSDEYMGNGRFVMCFEMVDISGNTYYSEFVTFDVKDGKIYAKK